MEYQNAYPLSSLGGKGERAELVEDPDPDAQLSDEERAEIVRPLPTSYLLLSENKTNVPFVRSYRTESWCANLTFD